MAQQLVTLAAAVIGAVFGLLAPMVSDIVGRRARRHDRQQSVAGEILDLFAGGESLISLIGGPESPTRRRLYLSALRLNRASARNACLAVIALAGQEHPDGDRLQAAWDAMVNEVGAVARSPR